METSSIDLLVDQKPSLSTNNSIRSSSIKKVNEQIISPVPEKRKVIPDVYNLLSITFRQPYKVEFQVYDDGVAYRISTLFKDSTFINNEVAQFAFAGKPSAYFPQVHSRQNADIFHTSFEEEYPLRKLDSIADGALGYSPILVALDSNSKIGITESDLVDYPGMFLGGTGSSTLKGQFAGFPAEEKATDELYPQLIVTKRAPYIARTAGSRSFPWAKVGEYIVTARKKGNDWFVAGMSDWTERDILIKFDFLGSGNYKATICKDGINANRYAADYVIQKNVAIKNNDEIKVHIAPGGGFLIRLDKQ